MQSAHNQLVANLARARDLRGLYVTLKATTAPALDLTDILRAAIVSAVSAFDAFIHEIARVGMVEIYQNARPRTDAFRRFSVLMDNVLQVVSTPSSTQWLEEEIRRQHGWLSFQQPDKVADAIRLFCGKELWKEVADLLEIDSKSAKNRLALIVDRRNKIAHEADMDPSSPGARWPIDEEIVQEAIDAIEEIAGAIYRVVTTTD
ncbi:HEPN domain-containing protein [Tautonia marina]|uniref:HEPN domain-containing protein n=1 Tax=Tautonia marina TaxID=2653855 RepID=UPI001260DBB2|nr:HEPN domain-containing protein [Tautonia marina]